ncbi:hypothetical protein CARUB_v10006888mg, partial [Capsella rubella]
NIITGCFFLAPLPTVIHIVKNKSVGEKTSIPYLATFGNCMVWFVYGLPAVQPFGTPMLITNGIGVTIMAMYLAAYFRYSGRLSHRLLIVVIVIVEVGFVVALATLTLTTINSRGTQKFIIDVVCCVCNILMYIAPISVLIRVVKSKSVEDMSFLVAFAMVANAFVWSIVSFLLWIQLCFSFAMCMFLGLVQLVVYAVYYPSAQ